MAAGAAAWLIADVVLAYCYGRHFSARGLFARLGALCGAIALVVIPGLALCVARAGFGAVWYAIVEFPLGKYGVKTSPLSSWGLNIAPAAAQFTFPRLLAWLPIGLVPTLIRLVWLVLARRQEGTARQLAWLVVFAASSVLSIAYFPGFVHIAFIAPVFYVIIAENVDWATRRFGRFDVLVGAAVTAAMLLLASVHLARNWSRMWELFPVPVDSAFGRVQTAASIDPSLREAVQRLADTTPSREVYVHPPYGSIYLMTGARNPTPHGLYTAEFEKSDIITWLERRRPPYAVILGQGKGDPVADYLHQMYEPMPADGWLQGKILRRRAAARRAPGAPLF
jgi:hypothetical protein